MQPSADSGYRPRGPESRKNTQKNPLKLRDHRPRRARRESRGRREIVRHHLPRPPRLLLRQAPLRHRHAHVIFRPGLAPHEALPARQAAGKGPGRAERVLGADGGAPGRGHASVVQRVGFAPDVAGAAGVGAVVSVRGVAGRGDFQRGGGGSQVGC